MVVADAIDAVGVGDMLRWRGEDGADECCRGDGGATSA
jgi:hypothetical protein